MAAEIRIIIFMLFTAFIFSFRPARNSQNDHRYAIGDYIPMFIGKLGPFGNPSETYRYFDLPFCCPDQVTKRNESFVEVLNADHFTIALYKLKFGEEKFEETLCEKNLTRDEVAKFRDAVSKDFYLQMYYDDLPFWSFIGKVEEEGRINESGPRYYLFNHVQFDVYYNDTRVIEIQVFSDPNDAVGILDITQDVETEVKFTYSVCWRATSDRFENRMDKYSISSSMPWHLKLCWFSVINSIVICLLLQGPVALLLVRNLNNELSDSSRGDVEQDNGISWKNIHGDVFRYPHHIYLFCAVLGAGNQLLTLFFSLLVLVFLGVIHPYSRGTLSTSLFVIHSLSSMVAGYTASSFHSQLARTGWVKSVILAGALYLGPLLLTFSVLNTVAISYGVTAALPFGTMVIVLLLWMLFTISFLILGGVIGYVFTSEFQAPCATRRFPAEIRPLPWHRRTPAQMFAAGLLPYLEICIELHSIYSCLWGYKIYNMYGILLFIFVTLIIVTAILSIVFTYIQLRVEDHKWWWRSILRGSSTAIFMYCYCIYFYTRSSMTGFLQLSFFFGYSACICYAFFLMLGTISFRASLIFVRHIYTDTAIKSE